MFLANFSGTYKPQIHTHYLPHLSLSFARHTISLNTTFLFLSSDYSKSIHLQADRSIEFHTPSGCHYTTRIPRYGRDLKYNKRSAEALVPAVGVNENGNGEVFRLNLEAGRYMRSYEVDVGGDDMTSTGGGALQGGIATGSVNSAAIAEESHNLLAFGTSLGTVEFWDSRSRDRVGLLSQPELINDKQAITAIEFHRSGLNLATGSSSGLVHLYDLRSPTPYLKKDQGYGYPIQTIIYLDSSTETRAQTSEPKILTADKRIIKIWDERDGTPWTSIEPAVDLNSVAWCKDSGMLLTANEGRQQHSFFIPQLGPAPKWCSFLDNLVEEMAEDPNDPSAFNATRAGEVYDNYKFLTMPQLKELNLSHLVGTTSLLRPYMHGYFVAQRLYEEARLIADPFIWEEQRAKRVKEKIESERESRIRGNKKVAAKVNKRLVEKILIREEKNERRRARRVLEKGGDDDQLQHERAEAGEIDEAEAAPASKGLLTDPRFVKLFQDEDFAIDETSREFKALNPSTVPNADGKADKKLTAAEEEAISDAAVSSNDDTSEGAEDSVTRDSGRISSTNYRHRANRPRQPQMQVTSSKRPQQAKDRSFGSRAIKTGKVKGNISRVVGEREITFMVGNKAKQPRPEQRPEKLQDKGRRSASGNVFRTM
jgi:ribosome biogenesis protein ENP2